MYADDTIVLAETERELQIALDAVHVYCNDMHLTVNTQKTKVMIFSRGKVRKHQNFMFGDSILDVTYEYVYLGVNFNYNTSFIKAIERLLVVCVYQNVNKPMFNLWIISVITMDTFVIS